MSNLSSSLPRRRRNHRAMDAFDRLPPPARAWAAQAALPWSAASVARAWAKALRAAGGCHEKARARLDAAEARALICDAPHIWGADHPVAYLPDGSFAKRR